VWLVHMNGRVYDQNLGRFLSVDPIVQGGGSQALNPYSYIQNNPLSGTDPSGYAAAKDECAGSKAGGCTMPEVKLTKAATMTGSHIAGVNTGAGIQQVNPTAGGMAELAVAMAGSKSGYVVQASAVLAAAGAVAADKGGVGSKAQTPQDRPGKSEASRNIRSAAEYGPPSAFDIYEIGQRILDRADLDYENDPSAPVDTTFDEFVTVAYFDMMKKVDKPQRDMGSYRNLTGDEFRAVATGQYGDSSYYYFGGQGGKVNITGGPPGFNGVFRASDVNYYMQGFIWAARGVPREVMVSAIAGWNIKDAAEAGSKRNWSGVSYNMEQIGRVSRWSNWGYDLYTRTHQAKP